MAVFSLLKVGVEVVNVTVNDNHDLISTDLDRRLFCHHGPAQVLNHIPVGIGRVGVIMKVSGMITSFTPKSRN